ncbi:MerR family transcriptional regulator [Nonomuraea jabiensis]|uniref:MerR family transcriptional regulator n=1 Tax=Nonomuraea jabiensis TaxID=882448 RepID=UPI00368378FB
MSDTRPIGWTIGELAERAALALRASSDGAPALNGRVRDVPGERLIRWYTTIGLVDPPLTRRGRVAQYGRRHLLQLVAVKRLQAAGHSIAEIQTALAGATDRMLETAAGLAPASGAASNAAPGTLWMPDAASGTPRPPQTPAGTPPMTGAMRGRRGADSSEAPDDAPPATGARPSNGAAERRTSERGATEQETAEHGATRAGGDARARGDAVSGTAEGARDRQGGDRETGRGRFWAERPGKGSVRAPEAAHQPTEPAGGPHSRPSAPDAPGRARPTAPGGVPERVPGGAPETAPSGVPETAPGGVAESVPGRAAEGGVHGNGPGGPGGAVVVGVRLGDGIRLVLDAGRVPSEEDVQAVLAAAGPLLAVLEERELT